MQVLIISLSERWLICTVSIATPNTIFIKDLKEYKEGTNTLSKCRYKLINIKPEDYLVLCRILEVNLVRGYIEGSLTECTLIYKTNKDTLKLHANITLNKDFDRLKEAIKSKKEIEI